MSGSGSSSPEAPGSSATTWSKRRLAWNAANPDRAPISVTVFDNYFRGVPGWLGELEGRDGLDLRNHDMRLPSPRTWGTRVGRSCRRRGVPHLLPGSSHRDHGRQHQWAAQLLDHAVAQTAAGTPVRGSCSSPRPRSMAIRRPRRFPPPRPIGAMSRAPALRLLRRVEALRRDAVRQLRQQHGLPVTMARPFNNYGPGMKITDGRAIADWRAT